MSVNSFVYNIFSFTDIFYYQQNKGNVHFKKFCETFLKHLKVKEWEVEGPIPGRLFLVFFLPSVNRQNKVDVISSFIEGTKNLFHAKGECNETLSFVHCFSFFNLNIPEYTVNDKDSYLKKMSLL